MRTGYAISVLTEVLGLWVSNTPMFLKERPGDLVVLGEELKTGVASPELLPLRV